MTHAHGHGHETSAEEHGSWHDLLIYNPASRHRRRLLFQMLDGLRFKSVLDVGCGNGMLLAEIGRRYGADLYGMDSFDHADEHLAGVALRRFYSADIVTAEVSDRFDVVVLSEVLEHVSDWRAALKNACRLSAGHVAITVPAGPVSATDAMIGHQMTFSDDSLARAVEAEGFELVQHYLWGWPWHSLYKWAQDLVPGQVMRLGKHEYSAWEKALCHLLYALFCLNLKGWGRQRMLLARRRGAA